MDQPSRLLSSHTHRFASPPLSWFYLFLVLFTLKVSLFTFLITSDRSVRWSFELLFFFTFLQLSRGRNNNLSGRVGSIGGVPIESMEGTPPPSSEGQSCTVVRRGHDICVRISSKTEEQLLREWPPLVGAGFSPVSWSPRSVSPRVIPAIPSLFGRSREVSCLPPLQRGVAPAQAISPSICLVHHLVQWYHYIISD